MDFEASVVSLETSRARIEEDVTRLHAMLDSMDGAPPDEPLAALRLHAYEESVAFLYYSKALADVLHAHFTATADSRVTFRDHRRRCLTRSMYLLARMAAVGVQKSSWAVAARPQSVPMETLLGFCVRGHDALVARPKLRSGLEAASSWLQGKGTALTAACACVGAVVGAVTMRGKAPAASASAWKAFAAAASVAVASLGAVSGVQATGDAVALRLRTRFALEFKEFVEGVGNPAKLDVNAVLEAMDHLVVSSDEYTVFLDALGATVASVTTIMKAAVVSAPLRPPARDSTPMAAFDDPSARRLSVPAMPHTAVADVAGSTSQSASGVFHLHPAMRGTDGRSATCVICLSPFTPRDVLVRSVDPDCGRYHVFHAECHRPDLVAESGCPVCRRPVLDVHTFTIPTPFVLDGEKKLAPLMPVE